MSGFDRSSCSIALIGTILTATCKRADGQTNMQSSIDLNSLIANDDGRLVHRQGGNFAASCSNMRLTNNATLTCTAATIDGSKVEAQINLSNFIANIDGQLRAS